jgi:hypothetical protein
MKKLLAFSIATLLLTTAINAQTNEASIKKNIARLNRKEAILKKEKKNERKALRKLEGKKISYLTKQAFISDFGNIPVTQWRRTANFNKATFSTNGQVRTAYYDSDSKLVVPLHTKHLQTFHSVPKNILIENTRTTAKQMFYSLMKMR